MKYSIPLLLSLFAGIQAAAQSLPKEYLALCKRADSLYQAGNYGGAANMYSKAFKSLGWKGTLEDRFSAARAWSLAGIPDSAFFQLQRIGNLMSFTDVDRLLSDESLNPLHEDKRWKLLLEKVRDNKQKAEANLDRALMAKLDSILHDDQHYREQLDLVGKKFGWDSKEMKQLWDTIRQNDSVNLIKVRHILDTRGWLGKEVVGEQGSGTLFLVIQHSDQATQEKYLPMMREAVKNQKASATELALLEDRVALGQGKRQIYGSQVGRDAKTNTYFVLPLEDPDHVDQRRASVGLGPLSEYVSHWQIKWDVEQYKKDLPEIESRRRR